MTRSLGALTTRELAARYASGDVVVLLPVGSTEPHGPHLPLATDAILSEEVCRRAVVALSARGVTALVAPAVPYGVTDFAAGFAGAVGVPKEALVTFLSAVVSSLLADGAQHVCLVNNHLEPAHDAALRDVVARGPEGRVSLACPLTRRWGRTLSDEYRSGACHAGRYETSLVLAASREAAGVAEVRADVAHALPPLPISLSDGIRSGQATFAALGMRDAYTGAPAEATREEGDALYTKLVAMVVGEVTEALGAGASPGG